MAESLEAAKNKKPQIRSFDFFTYNLIMANYQFGRLFSTALTQEHWQITNDSDFPFMVVPFIPTPTNITKYKPHWAWLRRVRLIYTNDEYVLPNSSQPVN